MGELGRPHDEDVVSDMRDQLDTSDGSAAAREIEQARREYIAARGTPEETEKYMLLRAVVRRVRNQSRGRR